MENIDNDKKSISGQPQRKPESCQGERQRQAAMRGNCSSSSGTSAPPGDEDDDDDRDDDDAVWQVVDEDENDDDDEEDELGKVRFFFFAQLVT